MLEASVMREERGELSDAGQAVPGKDMQPGFREHARIVTK
jgi:hypothetical protein